MWFVTFFFFLRHRQLQRTYFCCENAVALGTFFQKSLAFPSLDTLGVLLVWNLFLTLTSQRGNSSSGNSDSVVTCGSGLFLAGDTFQRAVRTNFILTMLSLWVKPF